MYPLKDITNYYKGDNYKNSFKPNYLNSYEITKQLEDYKTLSHTLKQISNNPKDKGIHNIYAIKNYYHLTAKISTTDPKWTSNVVSVEIDLDVACLSGITLSDDLPNIHSFA